VAGGSDLTLRGRPDRINAMGASQAVVDYKTGARKPLERLTKDPSEDGQLVLSAHMVEGVTQVAYLPLGSDALDRETLLKPVILEADALHEAVEGHRARLAETFRRLAAGDALPAMGDAEACRYCAARGLCRKDHRATP